MKNPARVDAATALAACVFLTACATATQFGAPQRMGQFTIERIPNSLQVFLMSEDKYASEVVPLLDHGRPTIQRALERHAYAVPSAPELVEYEEGNYKIIFFCRDVIEISEIQVRERIQPSQPDRVPARCKK